MTFEVLGLYDLPERGVGPFDITGFNGLFYHLPDPVTGLKIAADLTRELIVVNTSTKTGLSEDSMALDSESAEHPLSGMHGLAWLPAGPQVLDRILRWLGFVETKVLWWTEELVPGGWARTPRDCRVKSPRLARQLGNPPTTMNAKVVSAAGAYPGAYLGNCRLRQRNAD